MVILFVILFAAATSFGCSDEKAPEPPGQEKKADKPAPEEAGKPAGAPGEKKAEPAKTEQASPDEAEPTEPDSPAAEVAEEPGGDIPTKPIEPPRQIVRALARTALHGGMAPLDTLVGKVGSLLSPGLKVMLETAVYQGLLAEISGEISMANMDWFSRTRSIRIAVHSKDSVVLLVPVVSRESLLAALPEAIRTEVEEKTLHRFKLDDIFAEVVGKDLLLSDKEENIDQLDGALKLELAKLQVDKLFSIILEGSSLHPLISTSLEEAERGMEQVAPMDPTQKEFFAKLFNLLKDIVAEIDRVEISLDIDGHDLVLNYSVKALDSTNLHTAISGASNMSISTLKYMPSKSWLVSGQNIDPKLMMPWLERYMDILAAAHGMSTDEKIELWKDYKVMIELMTGDASCALYNDAGFPLSMTMVSEVADGAKMAELVYSIYDYFFQKAMDTMPPESRQMFSGRTLKALIAQIQPMVKSFGVDLMLDSEIYEGIQMDYLRIALDYSLMNLAPDKAWLKDMFKDKFDFVVSFSPKYLIFTMGPNGLVRAKEIVDDKAQLNPAELFPGVDAGKYNFVMNFDPLALERALEVIPEFHAFVRNQIGPELKLAAGHKGIFFFGGVEDSKAWFDVRLDLEKLMPLIEYAVKKEMTPDSDTGGAAAPEK